MELGEEKNKMEWHVAESVLHKQHADSRNYITEWEFGEKISLKKSIQRQIVPHPDNKHCDTVKRGVTELQFSGSCV